MEVKKIQPKELSTCLIFRLNSLYHAELSEFIAITDNKKEVLYVNNKVPQEDIDGFIEAIMFPEYWLIDDEAGKGKFLNYVYEKYGYHTCRALMDAHSWRLEQKEKQQAKKAAKDIIPLIEREVNSNNPIVEYDERLNYEIWEHGFNYNRSSFTPENVMGYGPVYEFYFGYLLGAGLLKGGGAV